MDNRIRVLIENGVISKQRSMFVIVGDKGRDQVSILLLGTTVCFVDMVFYVQPVTYRL